MTAIRLTGAISLGAWMENAGAETGPRLPKPRGLCFGPSGELYVTALVPGVGYDILRADRDPDRVASILPKGDLPGGPLNLPTAIVLFNDETLAVLETNGCRIRLFGLDGSPGRIVGGPGFTPGLFHYPGGLAVHDGLLWVADTGNNRVQLVDKYGSVEQVIGMLGDGPGRLRRPRDVACRTDGTVIVLDAGHRCLRSFDRDGKPRSVSPALPRGDTRESRLAVVENVPKSGVLTLVSLPEREECVSIGLFERDWRIVSSDRRITALATRPAPGSWAGVDSRSGEIVLGTY